MSSKILYRVSSVLFVAFGMGHTLGFLSGKGKPTESFPVLEMMKSVHFETMGFERTYWDFYSGFGLYTSAYFFFAATLCWQFSCLLDQPRAVKMCAAPLTRYWAIIRM